LSAPIVARYHDALLQETKRRRTEMDDAFLAAGRHDVISIA
jgi:hypothetical protein